MKLDQEFVAITRPDGSIEIMGFMTLARGSEKPQGAEWVVDGWWRREPTPDLIELEIRKSGKPFTSWKIIDPVSLPARSYREALTFDGERFSHDMPKARSLYLKRLRAKRGPILDQLDREWHRANGRGDSSAAEAIEAKREELRELPATIGVDTASTIEELEALTSPLLEP